MNKILILLLHLLHWANFPLACLLIFVYITSLSCQNIQPYHILLKFYTRRCTSLSCHAMSLCEPTQRLFWWCVHDSLSPAYSSIYHLNLNLIGTLLQSQMTITQRRGMLVRLGCIWWVGVACIVVKPSPCLPQALPLVQTWASR